MSWGAVAGAAISVVGSSMSDGGGGTTTQSSEPWGPAAPWLEDLIQQGRDLGGHYQANPFNRQQQTGYQNLFSDLDHFRNTIAPQGFDFNNRLMNTNYQRGAAGAELGGYLKPSQYGANQMMQPGSSRPQNTGGLLGAINSQGGMQRATPGMGSAGLLGQAALQQLSQGGDGVYSTKPMAMIQQAPQNGFTSPPAGQQYGLIDWNAQNPWTAINAAKPAEPDKETWEQIVDRERRRREAGMGWQPGWGDM